VKRSVKEPRLRDPSPAPNFERRSRMRRENPADIVRDWQKAANEKDADKLLELSSPDIEIVGPRGSARGREALRDWLSRAGLTLETRHTFARGNAVVAEQHGIWRSPETDEMLGEADVATSFLVDENEGRITRLSRHDTLDGALADAGLSHEDEA